MSTISEQTISQQILEARFFAVEEMPLTLLPLIDGLIARIIALYKEAGETYGPEDADALRWFDNHYIAWQHRNEVQTAQGMVEQAISELRMLGDVTGTAASFLETPKGAARKIIFHLAEMVKAADDKKRGLEQDEVETMDYFLVSGLAVTRKQRENHGE